VRLSNAAHSAGTRLDVFDASGRYLGPVHFARPLGAYDPVVWTDHELYLTSESEDGTPSIMRYRIERTPAR
jgi:hypothetical protein